MDYEKELAEYVLKVFALEEWKKVLFLIICNIGMLILGLWISRTAARGFKYSWYCKAGKWKTKKVCKENIDNFPEGYFKVYGLRWYRNNIVTVVMSAVLFLFQTIFLNYAKVWQIGFVIYFSLFLGSIFVVPMIGRKGIGRMIFDEKGYRADIKNQG